MVPGRLRRTAEFIMNASTRERTARRNLVSRITAVVFMPRAATGLASRAAGLSARTLMANEGMPGDAPAP